MERSKQDVAWPWTIMQNFVKIYCQIKKFSIQGLDQSYSGPISAVPRNEQLIREKLHAQNFRPITLVCNDRRTNRRTVFSKVESRGNLFFYYYNLSCKIIVLSIEIHTV